MDGPHAFQVYLRLRPPHKQPQTPDENFLIVHPPSPTAFSHEEEEEGEHESSKITQVTIAPPSHHRSQKIETFSFSEVFDEECGQEDLFAKTVMPILGGVVKDGRDGMLATLGVSGSGKTHTILGSRQLRGMTQMSLDVIFRSFGEKVALVWPQHVCFIRGLD